MGAGYPVIDTHIDIPASVVAAPRLVGETVNLYAVIPSINRRETLTDLVNVLVNDGVHVIVIDTGYEPELNFGGAWQSRITIVKDHGEPKNISRWWNIGIDAAADMARGKDWQLPQPEYVVAVLNDDVVAQPGLVPGLA